MADEEPVLAQSTESETKKSAVSTVEETKETDDNKPTKSYARSSSASSCEKEEKVVVVVEEVVAVNVVAEEELTTEVVEEKSVEEVNEIVEETEVEEVVATVVDTKVSIEEEVKEEENNNAEMEVIIPTTAHAEEASKSDNKPPSDDPYSMFKVQAHVCDLLVVVVLEGRNITKGTFGDFIDTPDPYVEVNIYEAPDSIKKTECISNDPNPKWFETLRYYLPTNPSEPTIAKIRLLDSNYTYDEDMGVIEMDVNEIKVGDDIVKTFKFMNDSEVDIQFKREVNTEYDLRYSLALCKEEKKFREKRKKRAMVKMRELLGGDGPGNVRETPCIAVMGSGGGYRALIGFTGAISALAEMEILDCATYTVGLSGSTWCMSSLYSHPSFPDNGVDHAIEDMRKNMSKNFLSLLRPSSVMRYVNSVRAKRKWGQPVTFTDFFGLAVGEHLLGAERMETARLSDFSEKIDEGQAPFPLMTCLHVRSDVSAMIYHEWMEFSPYEIGMAKYGTFVRTSDFNNKFFMGVVSKMYTEAPLHFLMGVWGSAFSILFDRLVKKNDKSTNQEQNKQQLESQFTELRQGKFRADDDEDSDDDDEEDLNEVDKAHAEHEQKELSATAASSAASTIVAITVTAACISSPKEENKQPGDGASENKETAPVKRDIGFFAKLKSFFNSKSKDRAAAAEEAEKKKAEEEAAAQAEKEKEAQVEPQEKEKEEEDGGGFKNVVLQALMTTKFFSNREYRAGKILNFMRGLEVTCSYPLSPFVVNKSADAHTNTTDFSRLDDTISGKKKRVMLVDAGLTFNSPYPAVLRPQRFIDLILSFDFSARDEDVMEPFAELKLAEKWARLHNIPFPKIDTDVYKREGLKELYIFKDEDNPRAPIILHFCLCNVQYRKYSAPSVPREPEDDAGDFNIFAEETPFSTFDFHYEPHEFDKLHKLVRFNTLLNKDKILEAIADCVEMRKQHRIKYKVTVDAVKSSVYLNEEKKKMYAERFGQQFAYAFDPKNEVMSDEE